MSEPKISIVVPGYNSRWILPRLVESLRSLLTPEVEVIFVDDGSTDGSLEAFKELMPAANCIRQENKGVAAARNTGVRAARGEFVQLLDADDVILPGKLEAQYAHAVREKLDVVYSDWRMVIVDGERVTHEPYCHAEAPVEIVAALLSGWCVPPHSYFIRRAAYWEVGGGDETLVNAQDFDLVMRMAIAGKKFGYCPGDFADYYRYLKVRSLARGPRRQYWSDYDKAVNTAVRLLEAKGALTAERKHAAATKLHLVARNVYPMDRAWFERVIKRVFELEPGFQPPGSAVYRASVKCFGFARAEALAVFLRRFKSAPAGS